MSAGILIAIMAIDYEWSLYSVTTVSRDAKIHAQAVATDSATATPFQPRSTATPTVSPGEGLCQIIGGQQAGAARIERWLPLELAVGLQAECPIGHAAPAEILLAIDRSTSMRDEGKFDAAKQAVEKFVADIDWSRHRVGLIPFSDSAWVAQPLTDRSDRVLAALGDLQQPSGGTNIGEAIKTAHKELSETGRGSAVGVIVVLTDGRQSSEEMMVSAAEAARRSGIVIFAIGLGTDADGIALRRITADASRYYFAPTAEELDEVYLRIASTILSFNVSNVQIMERPAPGVEHVDGSSLPEEPELRGGVLAWERGYLTSEPLTITRQVRIARTGSLTPSADLWVEFSDGDGSRRRVMLNRAIVEVFAPTIRHIHLPYLARSWCFPNKRHVDVALVIDASNSMAGQKLEQAVAGAEAFIDLLDLRPGADRAALVRYDGQARIEQAVTGDRAALRAALHGLVTGNGTRIDLGLRAGLLALNDGSPERRRVIVLLTDGQQLESRGEIFAAAGQARAAGVIVHAVALGEDADLFTLGQVAGDASRLWVAPDASALVRIYRAVAGAVGCR